MRNFKITVDGHEYDVSVEEVAAANEKPVIVPLVKDTKPEIKPIAAAPAVKPVSAPVKKTAAPSGGVQIKAPMPGMILNLKTESGAQVKKGQVVLILEAMKMENDISAPADGIITFTASKGSTVETGEVIAVIS